MVKIQRLNKQPPVHTIALTKEVLESTGWVQGDVISETVIEHQGVKKVLLQKD
jgi:hypothetical protein